MFFLSSIGIISFVDYFFSEIAMYSDSEDYRINAWYDLMHSAVDADVVIMGSSRAWKHISPAILDSILNTSTYNLGMDGSTINRQIHKYNIFRKYNRKPQLIIQNIDMWTLKYNVGFQKEQFLPYFWNHTMRNEMLVDEPFSPLEMYIPMYRYSFYNLNTFFSNGNNLLVKGYQGQNLKWDGAGLSQIGSLHFEVDEKAETMFEDYLRTAKLDGIALVFVYTPLYIRATEKIRNLDEMYDHYQTLGEKYNIPILDYTNMSLCYDTTFFYNAMHLNKRGAELFSDSLANDLKRLDIVKKIMREN